MNIFMITFDFGTPSHREPILDVVRGRAAWTQISDSLYLVSTDESADALYRTMAQFTDHDDSLYVIPVTHPYRGFGRRHVNEWLDRRLPAERSTPERATPERATPGQRP